ncbi:MAG TPA: c-type cytochrome, partial [Isosphaeraceae bacterium]
PWLQTLLDDRALRGPALRALGAYADPETPRVILRRYGTLTESERADAVATLASRPAYALALLDAVAAGTVPRRDLSVTIARQLQAAGDRRIADRLAEVWGTVRPTSGDKAALLETYTALLTPERRKAADPSRGRLVFNRTCAQCHRLYDSGGDVGPDLTGSDRANPAYILENVLDPSAAVGRDFRLTTVATADGRLIAGIVREQSDAALVLRTANETIVLPREDVEEMAASSASMMPEGLLATLSPEEVRDLIAYLGSAAQVPLPSSEGQRPEGQGERDEEEPRP